MANICENSMRVVGSEKNLKYIHEFFEDWEYSDVDWYEDERMDITFESKWTFPEEQMKDLYNHLPDKENDIYITCLSIEYGNLYHALWVCDKNGWREV